MQGVWEEMSIMGWRSVVGSTASAAASVRRTASTLRGRALSTPRHSSLYTHSAGDSTCRMLAQWPHGGPSGDPAVLALGLNRGSTKAASLVGVVRDSLCLRWWRCRGRQRDVAPSLATPFVQSSRSQGASILVVRHGGLEGALSRVEAWQHIASSAARGFHHVAHWPANARPYSRPAGGPLVGGMFGAPAMGRTNLAAGRDVEVLCESGWRRGTVELVYSDKILVKFHSPSPTTTTTQPPVDRDEFYYTPGTAAAMSAVQRQGVAAASKAAVAAGVEDGGVGGAKLGSWRDGRVHASHARGLVTALPAGVARKGTPDAHEGMETTTSALSPVPPASASLLAPAGDLQASSAVAGLGGGGGGGGVGGGGDQGGGQRYSTGVGVGGEMRWVSTIGQSLGHVRSVPSVEHGGTGAGRLGDVYTSDRLHEVQGSGFRA